ncbi:MAG: hypothetical protein EAZ15_07985 [Sphingobacteriales bacterium]|nr:MAG: hypothetical protein EAZ15_07985 [Sphingobacteriales bacterium]
MLALRGTYQNGNIELEKKVDTTQKMEVIVTFLEEPIKKRSKEEFLELLNNGPIMSDEQYQDYLLSRKMWNTSEINE